MKKKNNANRHITPIAGQVKLSSSGSIVMIRAQAATRKSPMRIPPAAPPKKRVARNPAGKAIPIRPPDVEMIPKAAMASAGSACKSWR